MVRHIKKVLPKERKTQWIFKVNVELTYNNKPKVAFLSGLQRSYYPEDPGFSKFSLVHGPKDDDAPPCTYTPPVDRIGKPISLLGYGMGGLSGPRFPPISSATEGHPSPDKYQPLLNETELHLGYMRRKVPPEEDYHHYPPFDPYLIRQKVKQRHDRHKECTIGFGTLKTSGRFGKPPTFNTAGVGSYCPYMKERPPLTTFPSFGRTPVVTKPSTRIRCLIDPSEEHCIDCGKNLEIMDYYRTKRAVRIPKPETKAALELRKDHPTGFGHVNLCNVCYLRAKKGHSKNWPKSKLVWLFQKTRTCATVHDHDNLPEIIHKTTCKAINKLRMKESILSRFFPDRIEESIIAAKEHYYVNDNKI